MSILLTDDEIKVAKAEALRLSWTYKAHPIFEQEKYLLEAQLKNVIDFLMDYGEEKTLEAYWDLQKEQDNELPD